MNKIFLFIVLLFFSGCESADRRVLTTTEQEMLDKFIASIRLQKKKPIYFLRKTSYPYVGYFVYDLSK